MSSVTPWKLTCSQQISCTILHTTALCAWIFALALVCAGNETWPAVQRNYQITLGLWAVCNGVMQAGFVGCIFLLGTISYATNETLRLVTMMLASLWIAGNITALVIGTGLFWHDAASGTFGVYCFSIVLCVYLSCLLLWFLCLIYLYVWPASCVGQSKQVN